MPARTRRPRRNDALSAALGYFRDLGVREVHLPKLTAKAPPAEAGRRPAAVPPTAPAPEKARSSVEPADSAVLPAARAFPDLASVQSAVAACQLCGLCRTRTQTVFADGTGRSRLMFVGEAPGADEDATGVPFVGRAGQLLTKMVESGWAFRAATSTSRTC
jgi:DNA polymerase